MKLTIQCELSNLDRLLNIIFQLYLVDKAIYVNMDSFMTEILTCEHFSYSFGSTGAKSTSFILVRNISVISHLFLPCSYLPFHE